MKFKDLMTGNMLETENEMVIDQLRRHGERYVQIEADERRPGRPKKEAAGQ